MSRNQQTAQDLNKGDAISRKRWSIVASCVLIKALTVEGLHAVVARGFDEFERVARTQFHGHGFYTEDYRRMFGLIKRHAELNPIGAAIDNRLINKAIVLADR